MPRYLTAQGFRAIGLGVNLTETSDALLEQHVATASALVNVTCAAPPGHDFKGGTVVNEPHEWDLGNQHHRPANRVYPFHHPIRTVSRLSIEVTNTPSVTLNADKLYVEEVQGYVEPISLVVSTIGIIPVSSMPLLGLQRPVARIDYTYGWQFDVEDEVLTTQSGTTLRAANQFWFTDEDVIVKKNGTTQTLTSDYTIDFTEGTITPVSFNPTAVYTVSYSHHLPPEFPRAMGVLMSDLIGYVNINASGLSGLSGIRVEEIELRQSSKAGFISNPTSLAVQGLLAPYRYLTMVHS